MTNSEPSSQRSKAVKEPVKETPQDATKGAVKAPRTKKKPSTALAVGSLSKLPGKISPSRAKDYMQCPKLFYYKTILGLKTPNTVHTARGTLAHAAFEMIFDHPREERTIEVATAYVEPAWKVMKEPLAKREEVVKDSFEDKLRTAYMSYDDLTEKDSWAGKKLIADAKDYNDLCKRDAVESQVTKEPKTALELEEELLSSSKEMVKNWFSMENPQKFDAGFRELHVQAEALGVTMHGYIDRLDRISMPDGSTRVFISDYKTGSVPGSKKQYAPHVMKRIEDDAFFAMRVYALLYWEMHKVMPYQLRLIYVKTGDRHKGIKTQDITPALLDKTRSEMSFLWKQIKTSAQKENWETKTGPLCNWCHFQDVCPAFNNGVDQVLPEELELFAKGAVDESQPLDRSLASGA